MRSHPLRRGLLVLLSLLILLACQIPAVARLPLPMPVSAEATAPVAPLTETPSLTTSPTLTQTATPTQTATSLPTVTPTFAPPARRVVIISIDGLRPDAIFAAPMPNLITLMQSGAFSLGAQTVFPSVTLVAHASMLSGLCPSKHGVDWNEYLPNLGYAEGTDLFDLAHAASLKTVMYVGKQKLSQVTEPTSLDTYVFINDSDTAFMGSLIANFPDDFGILFIHLLATDLAGHAYGWLSPQQMDVIRRADEALGMLLAELEARNLRGETLIIVTSDHGGIGHSHGGDSREEMTIPWIAAGAGIRPVTLTTRVQTIDSAATAAFALGLPLPAEWDGVPIYEAFGLPVERQSLQCQ